MQEYKEGAERDALLSSITHDIQKAMADVYGDRLAREGKNTQEIRPGIPNYALNLALAAKIRQLLATLHNDGSWADTEDQYWTTKQSIERNQITFGETEPEQETELLFSGNDKYGLVYGLRGFASEHIPAEQLAREGDRLYTGWYVELFNRYVESRPKEMYPIAKQIAKTGLPLEPWIQTWMKQYEQNQ